MGVGIRDDFRRSRNSGFSAGAQRCPGDAVRPLQICGQGVQADLFVEQDLLGGRISATFEPWFHCSVRRGVQPWSVGEEQLLCFDFDSNERTEPPRTIMN